MSSEAETIKTDSNFPEFYEKFIETNNLDQTAAEKLYKYAELIIEWNEKFNLTSKKKVTSVVRSLFQDSLTLGEFVDLKSIKSIADAGTGAGIPGLVLKITNPHLNLVLIEVKKNKRLFLEYVANKLNLENVIISELDWRTFNRNTNFDIDLFVTKAAFDDSEIIRMFRKNSYYAKKSLVYWASQYWEASKKANPFVRKQYTYSCDKRTSQLVLFADPELVVEKKSDKDSV